MEKLDEEYARLMAEFATLERRRITLREEDTALSTRIRSLREAAAKALCPYREGDLVFCHSQRKGTYQVLSVYLRYYRVWAMPARRYNPTGQASRAEIDLWESHGLSLVRAAAQSPTPNRMSPAESRE